MNLILYLIWQQVKQHRVVIAFVAIALIVVIGLIIVGYSSNAAGFNGYTVITTSRTTNGVASPAITTTVGYQPGKSLWDWLQLLIIPAVLTLGGYVFSLTMNRREQKATDQRGEIERLIAYDHQCETMFQEYIDKMSELLLEKQLRKSKPEEEVRTIARVRTLTLLSRLDRERKKNVLQFLQESELIDKGKSIIDLSGADLNKANLRNVNLRNANLSEVDLTGANLAGANLTGANLSKAVFLGADLWNATLTGANLREASISLSYYVGNDPNNANLRSANLSNADLSEVTLSGADLTGANLSKAILVSANLRGTVLNKADLRDANLTSADLMGTDLTNANLTSANLTSADLTSTKVTKEQLKKASTLELAKMPDGSTYSQSTNTILS